MTPAGDEQLLVDPVLGWRYFKLSGDEDHPCLRSIHAGVDWPSEPNAPIHARCKEVLRSYRDPKAHRSPGLQCGCGVHACYHLSELRRGAWDPADLVIGAVALWGRVVPHADAMRAEWALPLGIHDPLGRPRAVGVALRMGIPLAVDPAALEAEALEHAKPFPSQLRPEGPPETLPSARHGMMR